YMPKNAIWLGWSLGGLITNLIGLYYPKNIRAIITVASSPCFTIRPGWPGINPEILKNIYNSLNNYYEETIQDFIDSQILNISQPYQYISILKKKYYHILVQNN
ncbi:MAG TPA: hypothetical protein VNF93_01235, partial [Buchnera sp. (in: enterobacteria)]|nr:hypothetical protein [Buchnera sp. (in: enterobacteria)]